MRTISGCRSLARSSNWMPSMPGICMSVTSTSNDDWASSSRASGPLDAKCIDHSLRMGRNVRRSPCNSFNSSSTKSIVLIKNPLSLALFLMSLLLARACCLPLGISSSLPLSLPLLLSVSPFLSLSTLPRSEDSRVNHYKSSMAAERDGCDGRLCWAWVVAAKGHKSYNAYNASRELQ